MIGHKGLVVGYVRVSSTDRNEVRHLAAIGDVEWLFSEKVSGKSMERELLEAMLAYVRDGDVVRVKSPDRLSRPTRDLRALVETLQGKGVELELIDDSSLTANTPQGEFTLTILAASAPLERAVARERQAEGVSPSLRPTASTPARKPNLTDEAITAARDRALTGVPKAAIA